MKSKDLEQTQTILQELIVININSPMSDYKLIKTYLTVVEDIDTLRRNLGHDETFGVYE